MSGSVDLEFDEVSELFRCLSSPVRVALIVQLTQGDRTVNELTDVLDLPQPLVSQHLRVLRDHDLVARSRRGRTIAYTLVDQHVAHIVADALTHSAEERHEHPGA